jgi:hypothetical protein
MIAMAVFWVGLCAGAQEAKPQPQPSPPQETKYTNNSFARLSFIDGSTYIQRAADLAYEEGQVNMAIAEGDRIGTTDGRAEIYIGKKSYIRLDQNAKIDFLALPKKDTGLIRVREWAGNLYLDVKALEKEKAIEVITSDATFYILDNGLYRIDVKEGKETEILVFSGMVEASGAEGSMLVKQEQRVSISEGRFLAKPSSFFAAVDDGFDRFNADRASKINRTFARRYLSGDLEDFEYELDESGDWVANEEFGNVWVPRGMASDWRPYSYGRWMWLPMAGWSWLPYEPWGWSTYHYGRWHWGMNLGWYWIPTYMWGPAWVNWWWDYDYYGWAPMSYWGYPGIIIDNFYYGRGWRNYGDYPYNSRALTVIHKNQLQVRDVRKASLNPEVIKSVGRISLTNKSLNLRPSADRKISVEQMEGGNRVILRKSGEGGESAPANKPERTIGKGRVVEGAKTGEQKTTEGQRKVDPKTTADPKISAPPKKGETPPPAAKTGTGERKIRKKMDGEGGGSEMNLAAAPNRNGNLGYPSRDVARQSTSQGSRVSKPNSVLDRVYRSFSAPSRSSSAGRTSSGTVTRSTPRTGSSSASRGSSSGSSGSRSSSSGSSGSRSGGGSIRKK